KIWEDLKDKMDKRAVYHIWKERNSRLFSGEVKDGITVLKIITESVKLQLIGLKVKKSSNVDKLLQNGM
ncbi:hypothetical protein Tco_0626619, partial [Tanacetum coccineum]